MTPVILELQVLGASATVWPQLLLRHSFWYCICEESNAQNKNIRKLLKFERQEVGEKIHKQVTILLQVGCDPDVAAHPFRMCAVGNQSLRGMWASQMRLEDKSPVCPLWASKFP